MLIEDYCNLASLFQAAWRWSGFETETA